MDEAPAAPTTAPSPIDKPHVIDPAKISKPLKSIGKADCPTQPSSSAKAAVIKKKKGKKKKKKKKKGNVKKPPKTSCRLPHTVEHLKINKDKHQYLLARLHVLVLAGLLTRNYSLVNYVGSAARSVGIYCAPKFNAPNNKSLSRFH